MGIDELNEYQHNIAKKNLIKKRIEKNLKKIEVAERRYEQTFNSKYLREKEYLLSLNNRLQSLLESAEKMLCEV